MTSGTGSRFLFVTRFSLSKRSAIGVQTVQLMAALPGARHMFWEQRDVASHGALRLNSFLASRVAAARNGRMGRYLRLSWWRGDRPDARARRLLSRVAPLTAALYLAPLDEHDATRMRAIAQQIGRPFVLHLWDMLDGVPSPDGDLAWLVSHATHVFCLAPAMAAALRKPGAGILLFDRPAANARARAPQADAPFRIAIIGDVTAYASGVVALGKAVYRLNKAGGRFEIMFIGPKAMLKRLPLDQKSVAVKATGFLPNEARDQALARCHAGFMPGPAADPTENARSRFSIPSKILDYLAAGLPVLGTTHPRSATAAFAARLDLGELGLADDEAIAQELQYLAVPETWARRSDEALEAYQAVHRTAPAETLAATLQSLSAAATDAASPLRPDEEQGSAE